MRRSARSGQAMVETLLAVLTVTALFFALFSLSGRLTGKIMLEHAAMRVARARTVGFNDFMCRKTADVAVIPVAGRRLWPADGDLAGSELNRIGRYMESEDWAEARGVLEYEHWSRLSVDAGDGTDVRTAMKSEWFDAAGRAGLEDGNYRLFMNDMGL